MPKKNKKIMLEISGRHIHLSHMHLDKLFGRNHRLVPLKKLSQTSEFAAQETVEVRGSKASLKDVRIVGPLRDYTQIELSGTDCHLLGINAPVRISGDIKGSAPVILIGPKGTVKLSEGAIIAQRHLHLSDREAKQMSLRQGEKVSVKITGLKGLIFNNVVVRTDPCYKCSCHLDTDEANAAGMKIRSYGELIL